MFLTLFQNVTVFAEDIADNIGFTLFFVLVAAFPVYIVISLVTERKKRQKQLEDLESFSEPSPTTVTKATVISKSAEYECHHRSGKKITVYYMTFLKEDGEKKEYIAEEMLFRAFNEGDEGTLVTVDDKLLDFFTDEEVIE